MKNASLLFVLVCLLAACHKDPIVPPAKETPHRKTTTFRLYKYEDYLSPLYDSTYVEVELAVYKIAAADGTQTLAWDTVLARKQLRQYPVNVQPLTITKTVDSIYDSKQRMIAVSIAKYSNQGTTQVSGSRIPYQTGVDSLQVNVVL